MYMCIYNDPSILLHLMCIHCHSNISINIVYIYIYYCILCIIYYIICVCGAFIYFYIYIVSSRILSLRGPPPLGCWETMQFWVKVKRVPSPLADRWAQWIERQMDRWNNRQMEGRQIDKTNKQIEAYSQSTQQIQYTTQMYRQDKMTQHIRFGHLN